MKHNRATLLELIRLKELELDLQGQLLKTHYKEAADSLRPSKLLNTAYKDITQSDEIKDKVLGLGLGLAAGFVSKKIITAGGNNPLIKLAGNVVQLIVSSVVSGKSDKIREIINSVIQTINPSDPQKAEEKHESES